MFLPPRNWDMGGSWYPRFWGVSTRPKHTNGETSSSSIWFSFRIREGKNEATQKPLHFWPIFLLGWFEHFSPVFFLKTHLKKSLVLFYKKTCLIWFVHLSFESFKSFCLGHRGWNLPKWVGIIVIHCGKLVPKASRISQEGMVRPAASWWLIFDVY